MARFAPIRRRLSGSLLLLLQLLPELAASTRSLANWREISQQHDARCDLCEHNWLFILSAGGRTGSTTALSMLNGIPGVELEGEHDGALLHLANFAQSMGQTQRHRGAAWHSHTPDYHAIKCEMHEIMRRLLLGQDFAALDDRVQVLGFKEIRYSSPEMLHFLSALFPCARFVLNYRRKVNAPIRAGEFVHTAEHPDTHAEWSRGKELFRSFHESFPDTTAELALEDMSADTYNDVLHRLLGVRGCTYTGVVHDNRKGGYSAHLANKVPLEGECDASAASFRLSDEEKARNSRAWERLKAAQLGQS
mmetsp:Transcript_26623/g.68380  ORF Transcript_26623/g.68380 Transcript_26623/m.68380 type:complete len:306 (+) Transcript_26623:207-1124(+)